MDFDFAKLLTDSMDEMIEACTKEDTNKNFIIMVEGIAVEPANNPRGLCNKQPHTVKRFTHKDAKNLAIKCKNGNGKIGQPKYWRAETEDAIQSCERNLETIKNLEVK